MSLADDIRRFVYRHYLQPGFAKGAVEVSVRSGEVHRDMRFQNRMPAVCAALDAKKFQEQFGLRLVDRSGPAQSSTVVFVFCRYSGVERAASSEARREMRDQGERQKSDTAASRTHLDRVRVDRSIVDDTVFLVSCVSGKRRHRCAARDLYISDWFIKARRFVESTGRPWFILSAEHGLVHPDTPLDPYETTLNTMPAAQRRNWANRVDEKLRRTLPDMRHATLLAGQRYREHLGPLLTARGIATAVPMVGLRIGEQLAWLGERTGDG